MHTTSGHEGVYIESEKLAEEWRIRYMHLDHTAPRTERRLQQQIRGSIANKIRTAFVEANGLRDTKTKRKCLCMLLKSNRCQAYYHCENTQRYIPWHDHTEMFYSDNGYVYTTQPYDLTEENVRVLRMFCVEHYLSASISLESAWHYPGRCPLVVVHKQDVDIKFSDQPIWMD